MRFLFLTAYYPPFLDKFFKRHENVSYLSFEQLKQQILDEHFAETGALYHHIKKAGHEAFIIISNCEILQRKWAEENNVKCTDNWKMEIALAQVKHFAPDVFYLEYVEEFFGDFVKEVKPFCKYIASWISSPLNESVPMNGIDLIFSSTPDFINSFKNKGFKAEYMHPGFDVRILDKINNSGKKDIPFSFVGGWSDVHVNRKLALTKLVKHTPIKLWGYSYKREYSKRTIGYYRNLISNINNDILKAYKGEAWGLEMYNIIQRSLITFNIHESLLKGFVGNMRMFEATGVGTMILNDEGVNLSKLFVPGKEIETYSSIDEAIEKANYFIRYPEKAIEIGKNAQARTVRDYNYDEYVKKLLYDIKKNSGI